MGHFKEDVSKKMIALRDGDVFNGFVKAEALSTGKNESAIVEEIIIDHYSNHEIPEFKSIVAKGLSDSGNAVLYVTREILKFCLENPDRMNNSMRAMVKFICNMEISYPTEELSGEISSSMVKWLEQLKVLFQNMRKKGSILPNEGEYITITKSSIDSICDLQDLLGQDCNNSSSASWFVPVLYTIDKFWNAGSDDESMPAIRNLKCIYGFLLDLCNAAHWADTYSNRNILFRLIKNIRLTENSVGIADPDKVMLNKKLALKRKELITNSETAILMAGESKNSTDYDSAMIISNALGNDLQKPLCIVLYNETDYGEVHARVSKMITEHMVDGFNDPSNFALIPLMFNGKYMDKRVRWLTI